jgi:hypothetical protein
MATYLEDIRQGDTKVIRLDYGKAVDVTGWMGYFILRENLDDTTNLAQYETTAGDNPADDVLNGLFHITVTAAETAALEPHKGLVYAVKVDKGNGVIKTLLPPTDEPNDKIKVVDGIEIE